MGGWIDRYMEILGCPFCGKIIQILFCEDASTIENEAVIISIASGKTVCPKCNSVITDKEITE